MANRFFTILIVPEKTSQVRRFVIPAWLFRSASVGLAILTLTALVMVMDYWYVMNQVGENKQLRLENRKLKQQVQVFKNKMDTIESTMERVRTFATRLKVITNIEDRNGLLQSLNSHPIPDAATNIGLSASSPSASSSPTSSDSSAQSAQATSPTPSQSPGPSLVSLTLSAPQTRVHQGSEPQVTAEDPEEILLRKDYQQLDMHFAQVSTDSLYVEQMLQDEYELLADQKAFLSALPTRKPAVGYFTSGFGVRKSPIGGREKMHEGLDIANRPGTPIKAPADGTVEFAGGKSGYGQTIVLEHGYGLETWYGHIRKILVRSGQKVRRGDTIALLGNSGRSTGPHVHYEVRVHGTPVDPLSYILEN